ncbi:MAG: response regulator transcription factor [Alphaproteobacteria bacterium]
MKCVFPIAIIDDDPGVRGSLETLLCAMGNTVHSYESGPAFLSRQDGMTLMSVLLDLRMDGMNGITVLDSIQRFDRPIPVTAMTAHANADVRETLLKRGALDVLEKPFMPDQLFAALARSETLLRLS